MPGRSGQTPHGSAVTPEVAGSSPVAPVVAASRIVARDAAISVGGSSPLARGLGITFGHQTTSNGAGRRSPIRAVQVWPRDYRVAVEPWSCGGRSIACRARIAAWARPRSLASIAPLIWTPVCQVPNHQGPADAGLRLGPGGGGRPGARRAVRLICAGWLPQDRVSSQRPLSRIERRRRAAAHSGIADALARRAEPAASWAKQCLVVSVGCRYRPAKTAQLTGHGDRAEGAALAAL